MLTLVAAVLVYDLADDSVLDRSEGRGLRSSRSLSLNERSWTRLEKDMVGAEWSMNEVTGSDEVFFEDRKKISWPAGMPKRKRNRFFPSQ